MLMIWEKQVRFPPRVGQLNHLLSMALLFMISANFSLAMGDVYKFVGQGGEVFYTSKVRTTPLRPLSSSPYGRDFSRANLLNPTFGKGYSEIVSRVAKNYGLDPELLHAVIQAESAYDPFAVSYKGAVGLMQLMPDTAARFGIWDLYDPEQNILGGARYLRELLGLFGSDVQLAVAAYNAGEGNVIKYGNRVPPFEETKLYVERVMSLYRPN